MERDMDLVRSILMEVEDAEQYISAEGMSDRLDAGVDEVQYHVEIMIDGGLLEGEITKNSAGGNLAAVVQRMSWEGHEFLDATRTPDIWEDAKKAFSKKSVGMTFDLAKRVAKHYAEEKLGLDE